MADTIFVKEAPEATYPREIRLEMSPSDTTKRQQESPARVPLRLPKVTPLIVRSSGLQSINF